MQYSKRNIVFVFLFIVFIIVFSQLKYQKTEDETNELEDMTNLETVRVLEGVALQHGFVGRLVQTVIIISKTQLVVAINIAVF